MSLFKIIVIIVCIWMILKIKRFITGIHMIAGKSLGNEKQKSRKTGIDIQDADYEDVE